MVLEEENYSRERGFVASFSPDDARDTRVVLFRWRVPPRVISVATSRPLSRLIAGTWFEFTAEFTKRPGRSFVRHGASYNAIPFRIRNSTKGRKYWNKIKTACVEISTSRRIKYQFFVSFLIVPCLISFFRAIVFRSKKIVRIPSVVRRVKQNSKENFDKKWLFRKDIPWNVSFESVTYTRCSRLRGVAWH